MAMMLNAQEPYLHQIFRLLGGMTIGLIFAAATYSITLIIVSKQTRSLANSNNLKAPMVGIAIGLCSAGLAACLLKLAPSIEPFWGDLNNLGSYIPALAIILGAFAKFVLQTVFILLMIHLLNMFKRGKKGVVAQIVILMALGFAIVGAQPILSLAHLCIAGFATVIVLVLAYYFVLRHMPSAAPWITGAAIILQLAQQAVLNMYPSALLGNIIAIIMIAAATWSWFKALGQ